MLTLNGHGTAKPVDLNVYIADAYDGETVAIQFVRAGLKEDLLTLFRAAGIKAGNWRMMFDRWRDCGNNGPRITIKNSSAHCVYILVRPGSGVNPALFRLMVARDAIYEDGKPVTGHNLRERLMQAAKQAGLEPEPDTEETPLPESAESITNEEALQALTGIRDTFIGCETVQWESRQAFIKAVCKEIGPDQQPARWSGILVYLYYHGLLTDRHTHWTLTKIGEAVRAGEMPMPAFSILDGPPVTTLPHRSAAETDTAMSVLNHAARLKQALKALDDMEAAQQLLNDLDGKITEVKDKEVEVVDDTRRRIDAIRAEHDHRLAELQSDLVELEKQKQHVRDGVVQASGHIDPKLLRDLADRVEATAGNAPRENPCTALAVAKS